MFFPLDIFKTDSDGSVLWSGAAEDFVAAKDVSKNSHFLLQVNTSSSTKKRDSASA